MDVTQFEMAMRMASKWQFRLNWLYEDKVMTQPQAGPRENIICVAASTQISGSVNISHFGVMYAWIPIHAPGNENPRMASITKTM